MEKLEIVLATTNSGKIKEIKEVLKDFPVTCLSLAEAGCNEDVEEDRNTFLENAIKKATIVADKTGKMALADDSGLEVDVLKGKPGVLSARFAGKKADSHANNKKLLQMMESVPEEARFAHFTCVMALAKPKQLLGTVEGYCYGTIGYEEKGTHGFGYDPLFTPKSYNKTFAQLGDEVKNKISHRAKALQNLKELFRKKFPDLAL